MNIDISVIICCYNSEQKIGQTLIHVAQQNLLSNTLAEIILVNNKSTDQTVAKAKAVWKKLAAPFRLSIIDEQNPGLNHARKTGIKNSMGRFVIFCDDDNWLDKDYLETVLSYFNANPSISILGGVGEAVFEYQKPWWFDKFYHGYAVGKQLPKEGYLNTVYGAGMAIRKEVLTSKKFNAIPFLLSDRKGTELSAGGDSEICLRARLLGHNIFFTEKLKFKHFLTDNRLTWKYLKKLHLGFAHSAIVLNLYDMVLHNRPLPKLYWLKKSFLYFGRSIKYSVLNLGILFGKDEGKARAINLNDWFFLTRKYLQYNFQINDKYKLISKLRGEQYK
jgi:glycosyltransferase involved in cell wall biosynthesis